MTSHKKLEWRDRCCLCSIVNCYGRKRYAIEAIELLYDEGFIGALAVLDADFDRVTNSIKAHEGVIYSESHDLDLDWTTPEVIGRYLSEVGDKKKCALYGSPAEIIEKITSGLKPISVTKLMNVQNIINYRLSDIDISKCFDRFSVDVDAYLDLIFDSRPPDPAARVFLKNKIDAMVARPHDLRQLTNGHDFHCALGVSLRNLLANRTPSQTWGKEVEAHLRLTQDEKDFKATAVYAEMLAWTHDNEPFRIFSHDAASAAGSP